MIDERTRHEMYLGLEASLGTTVADSVMQHLPPVGWADVATRQDLEHLELKLEGRLHAEINRLLLFLFPTIISSLASAVAVGELT